MKKPAAFLGALALSTLFSSSAWAHHFYLSLSESMAHQPGSFTTSIGWGHALPLDDFFQGNHLQSYTLYDPSLQSTALPFDPKANEGMEQRYYAQEPSRAFPHAVVFDGDSFTKKIKFTADSPQGTYQVAATSTKSNFTMWKDEKGRQKWGRVGLDEVKGAKEILYSLHFQSFAKSFVALKQWSEPKPLGHELEFIPLSDLSKVKVGDVVKFKILHQGEPLKAQDEDIVKAFSQFFGSDGSHFIGASIQEGIARFQVTTPGQWVASLMLKREVSEKSAKELVGKAKNRGLFATVSFFVKSH